MKINTTIRKGNNEKREYSFTLGALGTEATMEGPFVKGGGASYLVNYRYSTLSMLNNIGMVDYGGIPKYQDLSFKVFVPTKSFGTFSFFGLGGKSKITEEDFATQQPRCLIQGIPRSIMLKEIPFSMGIPWGIFCSERNLNFIARRIKTKCLVSAEKFHPLVRAGLHPLTWRHPWRKTALFTMKIRRLP